MWMLIAALFAIAPEWKNPNVQMANDETNSGISM